MIFILDKCSIEPDSGVSGLPFFLDTRQGFCLLVCTVSGGFIVTYYVRNLRFAAL
jgi:hypothetical protein